VSDRATLDEAARRFRGADRDPALLPAAIRKAVVAAVGAGADAATFADLTARAARAADSAERRLYLLAVAQANDLGIARRAMELALSDAVPPQLFGPLMQTIAERHTEAAFDFAVAHYDAVVSRTNAYAPMFMAALARNAVDAAFIERFTAFATQKLGKEGKESGERAKSAIMHNDHLRRRGLTQVDAWLRQREKAE
jgi:aminopeptidase N